jgi:flagellar hook-length control protein FliK
MNVPATAPAAVQNPASRPGTAGAEEPAAPDDSTTAVPADFLAALAKAFATGLKKDALGKAGAIPDGDPEADGTPGADGTVATAAAAAAAVAGASAAVGAAAGAVAAAVVPTPAAVDGTSATSSTADGQLDAPATGKVAPTLVPAVAGGPVAAATAAAAANSTGDVSADALAKAATPVVEKQTAASAAKSPGGREPGGRETDGGVVASGSDGLGHGETQEVRQPSGGADLSAPSPLPPDAVVAHAKTPATPANGRDATPPQADASATDAVAAKAHRPGTGDTAGDTGDGTGDKPPSGAGTKATAHEAFTPDPAAPPTPPDAARPAHANPVSAPGAVVTHADAAPRAQAPDAQPAVASPPTREPQHTAPPPPPAPAPDIDRLVRLDQLRSTPRRDGGEMRIEVTPEGLGPVEVRVVVRADAVHATLLANHDQAREALTAGRPLLEAALERSNLRLEGFTVDVGQQHGQPDAERQRGASANTAWLRANGFEVPAPTSPLGVSAAAAKGLSLTA